MSLWSKAKLVFLGLAAVLAAVVVLPHTPASAHGATSNPASRAYTCRFEGRANPMCAAAWDANAQALYDWNGLNLGQAGGRHRELIPNGKLCSAGRSDYAAMDTPGDWPLNEMTPGANGRYQIEYVNTAPHATAYYHIYLSKEGFDPTTERLGWDDLELVHDSGRSSAVSKITFDVALPKRSSRAVMYIVWQRSDSPEAFYHCSDVMIKGDGGTPTTKPPTTRPPTTKPPTTEPPTTRPSTTLRPTTTTAKPTSTTTTTVVPNNGGLTVRARGYTGDERLEVRVAGRSMASIDVTKSLADYKVRLPSGTPLADVQVAFVNDAYKQGYDRNVQVDYVLHNGRKYESEAESTFANGPFRDGSCASGQLKTDTLHCAGHFQYDGGNVDMGGKLVVRARGYTGDERFEVQVAGRSVASVEVTSELANYEVEIPRRARISDIRVAFVNDANKGSYDRNLQIDHVVHNGTKYESESKTTYASGPFRGGLCASGNLATDTLHCAGYFQYGAR